MLSHTMASLSGLCHDATTFSSLAFFNHSICRCSSCTAPVLKPVVLTISRAAGSPGEFVKPQLAGPHPPPEFEWAHLGEGQESAFLTCSWVRPVFPFPPSPRHPPTFPQLACRKCCHIHLECHFLGNSAHTVSKPQW